MLAQASKRAENLSVLRRRGRPRCHLLADRKHKAQIRRGALLRLSVQLNKAQSYGAGRCYLTCFIYSSSQLALGISSAAPAGDQPVPWGSWSSSPMPLVCSSTSPAPSKHVSTTVEEHHAHSHQPLKTCSQAAYPVCKGWSMLGHGCRMDGSHPGSGDFIWLRVRVSV